MALLHIFVLIAIVEAVVEYFGQNISSQHKPYAAAIFAIIVCVLYNADVLALLGLLSPVPFVGAVLTGLLASRGAGWFNDFVSRWAVR